MIAAPPRIGAREGLEGSGHELLGKSLAPVRDFQPRLVVVTTARDPDLSSIPRVPQRVVDQVVQSLPEAYRIDQELRLVLYLWM